ncbi:MAG: sugar phosphate isomerase/epimerase [Candidatus Neomarinimicrobiota bacterium]
MTRPITLFTGQFADVPLKELAKKAADWGYDGLELACWGDHLEVEKAAADVDYCKRQLEILRENNLKLYAISNHLAGQLVCDPNNDGRSDALAPKAYAGDPEKKRQWAVETMKKTAKAAQNLGIGTVNGFTGSSIWHLIYSFPPLEENTIGEGFSFFAKMWNPILDVFEECGVRFALEVHPTEIAFDIITARRALESLENRKSFGFNFDPSHFHWQMIDPLFFLSEFPDRIYHVHLKDAELQLNGRTSILGSHLNFGDPNRGWDFRSLGRGSINFEEIIRRLNSLGYSGPLSVEWEDSGMDREHGAREACEFAREIDFTPSAVAFDASFERS